MDWKKKVKDFLAENPQIVFGLAAMFGLMRKLQMVF